MKDMQQNIMEEKDKLYLEWIEINNLVDELCNNIIKSKIEIKDIFGLQRGGLIPASYGFS